jgi:hypothetical protein
MVLLGPAGGGPRPVAPPPAAGAAGAAAAAAAGAGAVLSTQGLLLHSASPCGLQSNRAATQAEVLRCCHAWSAGLSTQDLSWFQPGQAAFDTHDSITHSGHDTRNIIDKHSTSGHAPAWVPSKHPDAGCCWIEWRLSSGMDGTIFILATTHIPHQRRTAPLLV